MIQFFRLMNKVLNKDLQLFTAQQGGAESLFHFGQKVTDSIEIQLRFQTHQYQATLVPDQVGGLLFKQEACNRSKVKR